MDFIEELYFGRVLPHEHIIVNENYKKALKAFQNRTDELDKQLSTETKKLLEAVFDADAELYDISETEKFMLGFRLGVHMMLSCFYCDTFPEKMLYER